MPGMGHAFVVAGVSYAFSFIHPSFDPLVISIIFGMLSSNLFTTRKSFAPGAEVLMSIFLPIGIGLYGARLSLHGMDMKVLAAVFLFFMFVFTATYFIANGFGLGRDLSLLLGVGLSICGASAIAVAGPLIGARKEDSSIAIICTMTVGLTGILIFHFIPDFVGLSTDNAAFLTGMALPMIGQVKVAGAGLGPAGLKLAMSYKLMRVFLLLPVAVALVVIKHKECGKRFCVPWFMVLFVALALVANLAPQASGALEMLAPFSTFSLTLALAAIGSMLNFEDITSRGTSPLSAAFLAWSIVGLTLYLVLSTLS